MTVRNHKVFSWRSPCPGEQYISGRICHQMQAEKVAGVDSELQIMINIFFFKGLYASLLTIYLKTFLFYFVLFFFLPSLLLQQYVRLSTVSTGRKFFSTFETLAKPCLLWLLWFMLQFLIKPQTIFFKATGRSKSSEILLLLETVAASLFPTVAICDLNAKEPSACRLERTPFMIRAPTDQGSHDQSNMNMTD